MDALNLVEEAVDVDGLTLSILRPRQADALISEEAFEHEEFLPYWAELWPSGIALADALVGHPLRGRRVLELGCGLALPALTAALAGATVLATDWSPDAIALLHVNAERNGARLDAAVSSWSDPQPELAAAPWDLVLAADVLYERRNGDLLLELLPRLTHDVLLADPGRPHLKGFLERAAADWSVARTGTLYHLSRS